MIVIVGVPLLALFDLSPLATRNNRRQRFETLAKPGTAWSDAERALREASYRGYSTGSIRRFRIDSRRSHLLGLGYTLLPAPLSRFLPPHELQAG